MGLKIFSVYLFFKISTKGDDKMGKKKESDFQSGLIDELYERFPGCVVMKNDARYIQGIPDLTVLYQNKWAVLEDKREQNAPHQPNQDYYIGKLNDMSFASFIYPENKEEVLNAMEQSFKNLR